MEHNLPVFLCVGEQAEPSSTNAILVFELPDCDSRLGSWLYVLLKHVI